MHSHMLMWCYHWSNASFTICTVIKQCVEGASGAMEQSALNHKQLGEISWSKWCTRISRVYANRVVVSYPSHSSLVWNFTNENWGKTKASMLQVVKKSGKAGGELPLTKGETTLGRWVALLSLSLPFRDLSLSLSSSLHTKAAFILRDP